MLLLYVGSYALIDSFRLYCMRWRGEEAVKVEVVVAGKWVVFEHSELVWAIRCILWAVVWKCNDLGVLDVRGLSTVKATWSKVGQRPGRRQGKKVGRAQLTPAKYNFSRYVVF